MRVWKILVFLLSLLLSLGTALFASAPVRPTEVVPQPVIVTPTPAPVVIVTPSPRPAPTPVPAPDYLLPDSASRYLSEEDLAGLTHEQLCLARNEIYARHGRIFKTPQIAAYFYGKSWYRGTVSAEEFSEKLLNAYESYNIQLIKNYENKYFGGSYY